MKEETRNYLNQALFETEQKAARIAATMPHDTFAAAVLATYFLPSIPPVQTHHFVSLENKRAWDKATGTIYSAIALIRSDKVSAQKLDQYLYANSECQQILGPWAWDLITKPETVGIYARGRAQEKKKALRLFIIAAGSSCVSALLFGILHSLEVPADILFFLACVGLIFATYDLYKKWVRVQQETMAAEKDYRDITLRSRSLESFQKNPKGGLFLEQIKKLHPLIHNEPPPLVQPSREKAPTVHTYVEKQIVERQVVVVPCKFCRRLTPSCEPTCQSCGAPGFGCA